MKFSAHAALWWISGFCVVANLACRPGGGSNSTPVDVTDFGQGSRLTYRITSKLDARVVHQGKTTSIRSDEQFSATVVGDGNWLEVQLNEMEVDLTQDGRRASRIKMTVDGVAGTVGKQSIAEVSRADPEELMELSRTICGQPFARFQVDDLAQECVREKLAPHEAQVLVASTFVDFVQMLLVPRKVDQSSWTRKCGFPLGEGVVADGSLTYTVPEEEWKTRQASWFLQVDVEGSFTADGSHQVQMVKDVPSARAGMVESATLRYSDSSYQVSGQLVYSRYTGQFDSGELAIAAEHTVDHPDGKLQMAGTRVLTLESVTPDRELPLPQSDLALVAKPFDADLEQQPRACLGTEKRTHQGWLAPVDLAFPVGILPPVVSPDGSTAFLLEPAGLLQRVRLEDLTVERSLALGSECRGLAWAGDHLVALRHDRLVLLDPKTLAARKVWQCAQGGSLHGCRALPWAVVGFPDTDTVWIVDVEQELVRYFLNPRNLLRIVPPAASGLERVRPNRLARGAFSPDGNQLVLLGDGFHRFEQRDAKLYYLEDSAAVNSDRQFLSISEDGRMVAIRSEVGYNPRYTGGYRSSGGIYVFDLSDIETPIATEGPMSWARRFVGNDLLLVSDNHVLRKSVVRLPAARANTTPIPSGIHLGTGELLDAIPLPSSGACLGLGREGSCWFSPREDLPELFRKPRPVKIVPVECQVEELTGPGAAETERADFPSLKLPVRLRRLINPSLRPAYPVVFSEDGRVFFALLHGGILVRGDMDQRRLTHQATLPDELGWIAMCPAGLVGSSKYQCHLFDPDDLTCLGRWDITTSHNIMAARNASCGVSVSESHPSLLWFDFERKQYRRVAIADIVGLDDDKVTGISAALATDHDRRFSRYDMLRISADGQRVLMRVYYGMFVIRIGPSWELEDHWSIPIRTQVTSMAGSETLALLSDGDDGGQVEFVDWSKNRRLVVPARDVHHCEPVWYNDVTGCCYVSDSQDLLEFDQAGKLLRELTVGKDRIAAVFGHPLRNELLFYHSPSREEALCWRTLTE